MPPDPFEDAPRNGRETPFEKVNDEAPDDAEPFVEPEPAPKDDEVTHE